MARVPWWPLRHDRGQYGDGRGRRWRAGRRGGQQLAGRHDCGPEHRGLSHAASDIVGTVVSSSSYDLIGTGGAGGLTNGTNHNQVGVNPLLSVLGKLRRADPDPGGAARQPGHRRGEQLDRRRHGADDRPAQGWLARLGTSTSATSRTRVSISP